MGLELLDSLAGEKCWHVSAGGASAPSFLLVLGGKIPRDNVLQNPAQPDEFRRNRGSVELLVWCSWRLQGPSSVLASSDQENGTALLGDLTGQTIGAVTSLPPAWDLSIQFSDGRQLAVFCDHLEAGSPIETNWELWTNGKHLIAGPGARLIQSDR